MQARKEMVRMAAKVGASFGALAFLVFGLANGLYVSSFGTLTLLNLISGGTLGPDVSIKILTILGSLLGIILLAAVSGVAGALLGGVIGQVFEWRSAYVTVEKTKRGRPDGEWSAESENLKSSVGLDEVLKKIMGTLKKGCCCVRRLLLGGA